MTHYSMHSTCCSNSQVTDNATIFHANLVLVNKLIKHKFVKIRGALSQQSTVNLLVTDDATFFHAIFHVMFKQTKA